MNLAEPVPRLRTLLAEPHHDGSEQYVRERPAELGGTAVVRLRVPHATAVDGVALRYVEDGEPRAVVASIDEQTETDTWWRAELRVGNPSVRYRWLLGGGDVGHAWVNGLGTVPYDVPDSDDFVLALDRGGPEWHLGSVVYQVFPDRFASSGLPVDEPTWAVRRGWHERPTRRGRETSVELFGGDLGGIEQRLDHLERLGVNVLYLTPIFPAGSTHRYDATSFDRVDPLLGGDDAFRSLVAAAHARGLRLVGDLTTNHCGSGHEWFQAAVAEADAPERELFLFDEALPNGYESWLGVAALPKLDWRSDELQRRMLAVATRWLDEGLDGWRIDVANMTGRYRDVDVHHDVARTIRASMRADSLLVAEHFHDFRSDLVADGWHGAMNYSGFLKPAWMWLRGDDPGEELRRRFHDRPLPMPRIDGAQAVAAMKAFRAGVPWPAVLHSWTLLDSHDTARFRTVSGSRARHEVGIGLQMTTPGVPMIFAGDELGLEGDWAEDSRRPMPWDRESDWDAELLATFRRLIALRRRSPALARGGIRYVHVADDAIAYLRECDDERLLCLAARAAHEPIQVPLDALGCASLESVDGAEATVEDGTAILPSDGPAFAVWSLR